jgi:hypothetical protein
MLDVLLRQVSYISDDNVWSFIFYQNMATVQKHPAPCQWRIDALFGLVEIFNEPLLLLVKSLSYIKPL